MQGTIIHNGGRFEKSLHLFLYYTKWRRERLSFDAVLEHGRQKTGWKKLQRITFFSKAAGQ